MIAVVLAEGALFATALVIFGALAAVLRTRAALRTRRSRAARQMLEEAASAERRARRLSELVSSINDARPRPAPTSFPPVATPRAAVPRTALRQRPGPVALVAAGTLIILVVGAIAVARPTRGPSGGVQGVRGVPATTAPSGKGSRATVIAAAGQGSTGATRLPAGPSSAAAGATPAPSAQAPTTTPTAHLPSPTPVSSAAVARAAGTAVATVGPCGASGCVVYVVRSGDTIGRVARRFGVSIEAILAVNPQLRDPNLIVTGQTLLLPSATP